MTRELAVWVLLAGLVGLLWVLTCVILSGDHAAVAPESVEKDTQTEHRDQQHRTSEPGKVAA